MSDRPPAAGPADAPGGYGSPRPPWEPGPVPPAAPVHAPAAPGGPGAHPAGGPYPAGPAPSPPAPRPRVWPPTRPERTVALAVVGALVVLGALLAPLWERLAPRLPFRVDEPGRALPVFPAAEEYVAADGWFVLVTLAAGIVAGLGCWLLRSSRGPLVLFALVAGGLLGALVTWRLGLRLGPGYRPEDLQVVGRTVYQPLTLRAEAALVVEPIAALLVYLLAVGFSARNDLGRGDEPPVSSGSG